MNWTLDDAHSSVTFSVRHMMVTTVRGEMKIRSLALSFDSERPERSRVRVALDSGSIATGNAGRDQHLRSEEFLQTETHPTIDFVSTGIVASDDRRAEIHGDLTIRGVTRPVVLDASFAGLVPDMQGGERAAFSATTTIDREEFGLTWNVALEQGGVLVSREVRIEMEIAVVSAASQGESEAAA